MKLVTSFRTLMQYAHELGQAKLSGDAERIEAAKRQHDEYRGLCLKADEMALHMTEGQLFGQHTTTTPHPTSEPTPPEQE